MPTTHINAYFQDVEDKKSAVDRAKSELEAAERRLEDKKTQDGFEEPKDESPAEASVVDKKEESGEQESTEESPEEPETKEELEDTKK